jgi:hypothetical protein
MVVEEVFVNFYYFMPITFSQKTKLSMCFLYLSGAGAGAGAEKFRFAAPVVPELK